MPWLTASVGGTPDAGTLRRSASSCGVSLRNCALRAGSEHLTHLYATAGSSGPGSPATSRAISAVSSKVCFTGVNTSACDWQATVNGPLRQVEISEQTIHDMFSSPSSSYSIPPLVQARRLVRNSVHSACGDLLFALWQGSLESPRRGADSDSAQPSPRLGPGSAQARSRNHIGKMRRQRHTAAMGR